MIGIFEKFANTTGIKAFGFAQKAKSPFERLFWSCLIVLGSFLTIFDVYQTVETFLQYPTSTKITLINNDSLNLGEPTLCMDVKLVNFTALPYDPNILNKTAEWLSTNEESLLNSTFTHAGDLLIQLIANTIQVEQGVLGGQIAQNGNPKLILPHFQYSSNLLPLVTANIANLNFSIGKLAKRVAAYLCRRIKLKIHFYDYSGDDDIYFDRKDDVCLPELMLWLGVTSENPQKTILCVKLPNKFFRFGSSSDYLTIKFYEDSLRSNEELVSDEEQSATLDFSGTQVRLKSVENSLWIPVYNGQTIGLYVIGKYERLNLSKSPCSSGTKSQCLLRCRHNYIRSECGCTPVFDEKNSIITCGNFYLNPSPDRIFVPGFNLTNPACLKIKMKFQPDSECESKCYSPCLYQILSYYYMPGKNASAGKGSRMAIFVDSFSFHEFKEILLISSKQLLGSIGGSLSLYLGASFVVLIHIIVFWLSELFSHYKHLQ